jgi:hypothetical protein
MAIEEFANSLNVGLNLPKNFECKINKNSAHLPLFSGRAQLCLSKSEWFGLISLQKLDREPHGFFSNKIRRQSFYSSLNSEEVSTTEEIGNFNAIVNLESVGDGHWNKIAKSKKNIEKTGITFECNSIKSKKGNQNLIRMLQWHLEKFASSYLNMVSLENLVELTTSTSATNTIYSINLNSEIIAGIWVMEDHKNSTSFFVATGYDPEFQIFSPGTYTLYKSIDTLREQGITWFDLGSGHHKYKQQIMTHCMTKEVKVPQENRNLLEKAYAFRIAK